MSAALQSKKSQRSWTIRDQSVACRWRHCTSVPVSGRSTETRVARIAADWDWKKAEAITVARVDARQLRRDRGLNRVMALRSIDPRATILCVACRPERDQAGTALAMAKADALSAPWRSSGRCTKVTYANAPPPATS